MVTLTLVAAGTLKYVVCTNCLVCGSWMKYVTQSGLSPTVDCAVVISVTFTWPLLATEV